MSVDECGIFIGPQPNFTVGVVYDLVHRAFLILDFGNVSMTGKRSSVIAVHVISFKRCAPHGIGLLSRQAGQLGRMINKKTDNRFA